MPSETPSFMPWWRVEFGETAARAAYNAVAGRHMTMGALTAEFERRIGEILGVRHVVSTASGTAALMLACFEAGVGPGDEVVVPDRTWIATAHAAHLLGATIVAAEVEKNRPIMDADSFLQAITPATKAVIPVHLNGRAADMPKIRSIAQSRGIAVIEDACQALFSKSPEGGFLGCHSRAGCFSLSIGKAISSGQGGFIVTNDDETAQRLVLGRTHGTSDVTMAKWQMGGGNFRFWDLPAAVALSQLDIAEERCENVKRVYQRYARKLREFSCLELLPVDVEGGELPLYVECNSPLRGALLAHLEAGGIQARPYYGSLHEAPQFMRRNPSAYQNSDIYARQCFVLPCGPDRTDDEIDRVLAAIGAFEETQAEGK